MIRLFTHPVNSRFETSSLNKFVYENCAARIMKILDPVYNLIPREGFGPPAKRSSFEAEITKLYHNSFAKFCLFMCIIALWLFIVPLHNKMMGFFYATGFAICEFLFLGILVEGTGIISYDEKGKVRRKRRRFKGENWTMAEYTTTEQFIMNLLVIPVVLPWYNYIMPSKLYRIMFTSVCMWTIQIIQGYFLIFLFGYNRAWQFFGVDAFFHGNIRMGDATAFTMVGLVSFMLLDTLINDMVVIGLGEYSINTC